MKNELLRMEGITCGGYGKTTLNDLSLTLYQGELLGVLSNHAAVKNDLVDIVSGRRGRVAEGSISSASLARSKKSISIAAAWSAWFHSVKTLVDDMSISENIFVIRKGVKSQIINSRLLHAQARQLMDEFGLTMDPRTLVRNLSVVERCILEIVKVVALGARIVVLHNLSSVLSDFEIEQLLGHVAHLKDKGVGFLMVDGSVGLLSKYADRVILIENGRNFWAFGRGEIDEAVLRSSISRRQAIGFPGTTIAPIEQLSARPEVLRFDGVRSGVLDSLSFTIHHGEALCIIDQDGQGIEEIKALLAGERQLEGGRILIDGSPFAARNAREALDQRIAFIVESPADTMLFPDFTALENLCYPASRKAPNFWINPKYLASCRQEYAPFFALGALDEYPDDLSSADLHKLVYCRWHLYNPSLVVCVKPFSCVDKNLEEISAYFIGLLLNKGIAVLILTSNASEVGISCRLFSLNPKNTPLGQKNDL